MSEAKALYQDFKADGFGIKVRRPGSEGIWDPNTMSYTGGTSDADYTTYGIKKNYSIREIDGSVVQQKDSLLIFPAYSPDGSLPLLTSTDQILIDDVVQNVVNIEPVAPANIPILYRAQVRA